MKIDCLNRKIIFLFIAAVYGLVLAACSLKDEGFLKIKSVSECVSDKKSLADFGSDAVKLYTDDRGSRWIEFSAMWYGREPVNEIKYSYSGDTLKVELYKKMTVAPGFNCPVWVKAEVHGNLDAKYLYVNAETFKL